MSLSIVNLEAPCKLWLLFPGERNPSKDVFSGNWPNAVHVQPAGKAERIFRVTQRRNETQTLHHYSTYRGLQGERKIKAENWSPLTPWLKIFTDTNLRADKYPEVKKGTSQMKSQVDSRGQPCRYKMVTSWQRSQHSQFSFSLHFLR